MIAQLEALNQRLLKLQKQLDAPGGSAPAVSQESLDAVAAQLAALEGLKSAPAAEVPKQPCTGACTGDNFPSFAMYAAEAKKVADTGRLPFGSDSAKIRM